MSRVVRLESPDGRRVVLVGGILGLEADEAVAREAFAQTKPERVLLGIPYEDLDAIRATSGTEATAEFESGELDDAYLSKLAKFGNVRAPPPDLYELFRLAEAAKVPIDPIDLGDEEYTKTYTDNVGILEVLRSSRHNRKLPTIEVEAETVEEFVRTWDDELYPTKGLRKVQTRREEVMAKKLEEAAAQSRVVLALVPLPRRDAIQARLVSAGWRQA